MRTVTMMVVAIEAMMMAVTDPGKELGNLRIGCARMSENPLDVRPADEWKESITSRLTENGNGVSEVDER
ncbi:hypothetical protein RUM43_007200 [Polyplax serrata]|uniref:Uncharacterized protein n=1 Tax=Polyplax serrata TaxID=468196 RepID=A0AAN8P885_POLSC